MKSYNYPCKLEEKHRGECVLALGFFDGVHAAHRDLISTAKEASRSSGMPLGIFTFKTDTGIKSGAARIYGEKEKRELFSELGADFVIYADFEKIKDTSPADFVKKILCEDIGCRLCVAGFNFKFGRSAAGDAATLSSLMRECGGDAIIKNELSIDGECVSATLIRSLIEKGNIRKANKLLGSPYFISGTVEHGRRIGRELGYPTVNTEAQEWLAMAKRGVYRSAVVIDGRVYSALTNIGTCPTFDERPVHAETYILDFSADLYGLELRVYLLDFLRDELRFESPEELCEQIKKDIERVKRERDKTKWQVLGQSLQ